MKHSSLTCLFVFLLAFPSPLIAEKTWKIGVFVCMTGVCAEVGHNSLEGIRLAIDEINARGGVLGRKIEILLEDTVEGQSSGAAAVAAFQKLLKDREIQYLLGPSWTPGGLSIAPLAAKKRDIIVTSPSLGEEDFNKSGDNIFCLWPHDSQTTKFLADFALENNWKKVAVLSSQQPWENLQGNTFEKEFSRIGGEVTVKEEPLPTASSLRAEVLRIKSSQPDAVLLTNYTSMGLGSRQLREIGYQGPLFAILMDDTQMSLSQGALEGSIVAGYAPPSDTFRDEFQKRYKKEPGIGADTSYDVIKLYASAVSSAGTFDVEEVREQMLKIDFQSASGRIRFDEFGGVKKTPVLYKIQGGKQVLLGKK